MSADWLGNHLSPFSDLQIGTVDLSHLEALSCLRLEPLVSRDLKELLRRKNHDEFDADAFFASTVGSAIKKQWDKDGLMQVSLTSVGQIIGVYVADHLTKTITNLDKWGH